MSKDKTISQLELEAQALLAMPDSEIDTNSIPEILDFDTDERGKFYRPVKKSVTLRLDADLLAWFRKNHAKYQTAINNVLREYVRAQL